MKGFALRLLVAVGALALLSQALRRARPRMLTMCERMIDAAPASFPSKRMLADLGTVRANTTRILHMLEHEYARDDERPTQEPLATRPGRA